MLQSHTTQSNQEEKSEGRNYRQYGDTNIKSRWWAFPAPYTAPIIVASSQNPRSSTISISMGCHLFVVVGLRTSLTRIAFLVGFLIFLIRPRQTGWRVEVQT